MTIWIPKTKIRDFVKDVKQFKIKHKPFFKKGTVYEIELYPNSKTSFLLLKYS